jgi:hypothetical protein
MKAGADEAYLFVIDISTGKIKFDQVVTWLKNNSQAL